jgi:two-component system sensor histidine kinase/response regulator
MNILIADDEPEVRDTLKDLLEINGHKVLAAEDGVQAVALAAQKPEFIFCDVEMPNLDGHGVLAAIKEMPGVRDVPFVFLTGRDKREQQRAGMSLGADDYITKPFTERDVIEAIASRTKRQRSLREQIKQLTEQHRREINAPWSHELLTPLNVVIGNLDLLRIEADSISRSELKEILSYIREGADRQERLSRKLIRYFNLTQAAASAGKGARERCSADDAIHSGATQAAGENRRESDLELAPDPSKVLLRGEWLHAAIYELVDNAFKFSKAGSRVTVTTTNQAGRCHIEITDDGVGMTPEQRAQIGAFVQFDRKVREQQGLGLGLAIARMTARLADGDLILEARTGRPGLRAILDLPLASR